MLDLAVIENVGDVVKALDDLEKRHVPFAMALALNKLASEGQQEVRRQLPDKFNIRQNWTSKGVRTTRATPKKLEARVYTMDWYMREQQEGGTRRPRGGHIAVPTLEVRKGGSITGRIARGMRPAALKKKEATARNRKKPKRKSKARRRPVSFIAKMAGGKRGIFIRKFRDKRLPITLLYTLEDSAQIAPRWEFDKAIEQVSDKRMRTLFLESMQNALATDRKGAKKSTFVDHMLEHPDVRLDGGSVLSGLMR